MSREYVWRMGAVVVGGGGGGGSVLRGVAAWDWHVVEEGGGGEGGGRVLCVGGDVLEERGGVGRQCGQHREEGGEREGDGRSKVMEERWIDKCRRRLGELGTGGKQ